MPKKIWAHEWDLFDRCKRCGRRLEEFEDHIITEQCLSDAEVDAIAEKRIAEAQVRETLKRIRR